MSDKTTLKTYFNTGDTPTESQFADLIDSVALTSDLQVAIAVNHVLAPNSGISAVAEGIGLITGFVAYTVTYVTADGETEMTAEPNVASINATSNKVRVTIPVSADSRVIARKVYRWGTPLYYTATLVATVNDNTTTSILDNIPLGSEGAAAVQTNSTSGIVTSNGVRTYQVDAGGTNIGWQAALSPKGYDNTNIGKQAGQDSTNDYWMTNIGAHAGQSQYTGYESVNVGYKAGWQATKQVYSVAVGVLALANTIEGTRVVAIGYGAGGSATYANECTYLGSDAGSRNLTGYGSTFLGSYAGAYMLDLTPVTVAENCIYIGRQSSASSATPSNEIVIGVNTAGRGDGTTIIGSSANSRTYLIGNITIETINTPDFILKQVDIGGTTLEQLRIAHDETSKFFVQVGVGATTAMSIHATTGQVGVLLPLNIVNNVWHQDNAGENKEFHYNSGQVSFRSYGSDGFDFLDGDYNVLASIKPTVVNINKRAVFQTGMNLAVSAAPVSPVDGDMWREDNTNTGLKIRVNGVTKTLTLA